MNDLIKRLLAHAAVHDQCTSAHSDEQAQWAADLREAARLLAGLTADDVLDLLEARSQWCREEGESDMRNILNTIRFIRARRSEGESAEQIRRHFRDDEQ